MLTCNREGVILFGAEASSAGLVSCFWGEEQRKREDWKREEGVEESEWIFLQQKDEITLQQMSANEVLTGRVKGQALLLYGK